MRPRRQITLPQTICEKLCIDPGDKLELSVAGSPLIITLKKAKALNALREIQEAFQRSGITKEELLEDGRKEDKERAYQGTLWPGGSRLGRFLIATVGILAFIRPVVRLVES